jgi:uncharacterized membrane protein
METKQIIGVALILVGIILLFFGWKEYDSFASEVSEMFTGSPTDNAVWYLTAGGASTLVGILLLAVGKK